MAKSGKKATPFWLKARLRFFMVFPIWYSVENSPIVKLIRDQLDQNGWNSGTCESKGLVMVTVSA